MRHARPVRVRQQVQFLRRQFAQDNRLPFSEVLTVSSGALKPATDGRFKTSQVFGPHNRRKCSVPRQSFGSIHFVERVLVFPSFAGPGFLVCLRAVGLTHGSAAGGETGAVSPAWSRGAQWRHLTARQVPRNCHRSGAVLPFRQGFGFGFSAGSSDR